ncbi:MAG: zinc ribbon domain-containing protein [Actinomycetota bacterium]|nr:zinc ribbon domain-containing protein [Actinomycetota bacterium]
MSEVTCPTCGTVCTLDDINRDSMAFCRVCDYPLFWVRPASKGQGPGGLTTDTGLRRLPGTVGLVTIATLRCWHCDEPNPVTGNFCIRCGVDLHPPPAPFLAPPPPPPPEPELYYGPPAPPLPAPSTLLAWVPAMLVALAIVAYSLVYIFLLR